MEDRSREVLSVAIFFVILSFICVCLRIFVRVSMLKSFGLDDWSMVGTQVLFTIYVACQLGGVRYGTGRKMEDLERDDATIALRYWYYCEIFYILSSVVLKLSIGVFLSRIAGNKFHLWIIWGVMASTTLFGTMYLFVVIFQCSPISSFWNINPGAPGCLDTSVVVGCTYAASVLNAMADWTFGILPFFIVWDLKMNTKAKSMVSAILAFAAIGSTATIIRMPYVSSLGETDDFLYATTGVAIWSTVEVGIGIAAGCIATLRPLLRRVLWHFGLGTHPADYHSRPSLGRRASGHIRTGSHPLQHHNIGLREGVSTTVEGGTKSSKGGWNKSRRDSDEEVQVLKDGVISKSVVVEYDSEERRKGTRDDLEQGSLEGGKSMKGTHILGRF